MLLILTTFTLYIIYSFHEKLGTSTYSPHIYVCVWGWRIGRRRQFTCSTTAVDTPCWRAQTQYTGHLCAVGREPVWWDEACGLATPAALLAAQEGRGHQPFRAMAFISEGSLSFRCNFRLETDDDFPKLKKERQLPTGDFFILFWGLLLWERK